MLVEPERTNYDLTFRLFGFPVRIHPLFWLGAVLLGANLLQLENGPLLLLMWVGVVFVSILVHEFGHALAFHVFGTGSHIVMYIFGGLAVPWGGVAKRWQRIVVSLAGPFAGFALCAAVYFSNAFAPWATRESGWLLQGLYFSLIFVNLYWGVMNLLPVFPLDGGQVAQEVCTGLSRRNGLQLSLKISIGVAGLIAVYSLMCQFAEPSAAIFNLLPWWVPRGTLWTALLFGMLAMQSYQILQQINQMAGNWDYPDDDRPPWRR